MLVFLGALFLIILVNGMERKNQNDYIEKSCNRVKRDMSDFIEKEHLREEIKELKKELKAKMPPKWDDDMAY
jgi:hypothetical protein